MATWVTKAGGLSGGGYTNCVAFDPSISGHMITGGDTFGFNESFDSGLTWLVANLGLYLGNTGVAGIVYDPVTGNAYGAMGSTGGSPTIVRGIVETHSGQKFTRWSHQPISPGSFWGGGNAPFLPAGDSRPRLTGRVLEVDNFSGTRYLYAGPYQNGIYRSTDDYATSGNTVQICTAAQIGIASTPTTEGILLDPTDHTRLLVARWGYGTAITGAALVSNARAAGAGAATVTALTNAPKTVLEFVSIGNNVYAACGWYGVYKVSGAGWNTWTPINTGLPLGTPGLSGQWYASGIDGYNDGSNDILVICSVNPQLVGGGRNSNVFRCTGAQGGSPSWEDVTSGASNVSTATWGSGETWFPLTHFSVFALNKGSGDMDNIAIDPFDRTHMHVTGRAGGWGTKTGLNSAATVLWRPEVNGTGGLTTTMFLTDPYRANHAYICDTDYGMIASSSDFAPGSNRCIIPSGAGNKGIWMDMGPDQALYATSANRDTNTQGDVYQYGGVGVDPFTASPVSTGFGAASGSVQPCGVAVVGTAAVPIIIVAATNWNDGTHAINGGIWRKVGSGSWSKVLACPPFDSAPTKTAKFPTTKDADGGTVYILDPHQGIFRSLDQGLTWTKWWAITNGISVGSGPTPGVLYVCRATGIWRIAAANVSGTIAATAAVQISTATGAMTSMQGMAVDKINNYVYGSTNPTVSLDGTMQECRNPEAGSPVFTDITDWNFRASCFSMNWTAVDNPGGQLFYMPSSLYEMDNTDLQPAGVGLLVGGLGITMGTIAGPRVPKTLPPQAQFISTSNADHDASSNVLTIPAPAGIADGDLLYVAFFTNGGTITWPSGWTTDGGAGGNTHWGYKFASGESGSYVFTSTVAGMANGAMVCYRYVTNHSTGSAPIFTSSSDTTHTDTSSFAFPLVLRSYSVAWVASGQPTANAPTTQRGLGGQDTHGYTIITEEFVTGTAIAARTVSNDVSPLGNLVINFNSVP